MRPIDFRLDRNSVFPQSASPGFNLGVFNHKCDVARALRTVARDLALGDSRSRRIEDEQDRGATTKSDSAIFEPRNFLEAEDVAIEFLRAIKIARIKRGLG